MTDEDINFCGHTFPTISAKSLKFKHPCRVIFSGASGTGKTTLIKKLLINKDILFDESCPARILWCSGEGGSQYQPIIQELKRIYQNNTFFLKCGLPSEGELEKFVQGRRDTLLVLDDLMDIACKDETIARFFTRSSHHLGVSIFLTLQNVFNRGSQTRNIRLNSNYLFLFRNPGDPGQINCLSRQIFPACPDRLPIAFSEAIPEENPFNYTLVDLHPLTPEKLKVRSYLFPDNPEEFMHVWA